MNREPEIEYTSLVDDLGLSGLYHKASNKIYLNPKLIEYPEMHTYLLKHEKQHYKNSKRSLPIRILFDVLIDYKSIFNLMKLKQPPTSLIITEETYSFFYDFLTFPLCMIRKNKILTNIILTAIVLTWFVGLFI